MIAPDLETAIDRLRGLIDRSRVIVPFTGAGISTECGIPDFRSPGRIMDQESVRSPTTTSSPARRCATKPGGGASRWRLISPRARPGRGHRALASLHRAGKMPAVITQNIDNLHQASGFASECVVELHGNTTYATCLGCGQRYELPWVRERFEADGRGARLSGLRRSHQIGDRFVRPGHAGCRDAACGRIDARLRSFHRHRIVAGGVACGGISADGKTKWLGSCYHQSRADRLRQSCRSRRAP